MKRSWPQPFLYGGKQKNLYFIGYFRVESSILECHFLYGQLCKKHLNFYSSTAIVRYMGSCIVNISFLRKKEKKPKRTSNVSSQAWVQAEPILRSRLNQSSYSSSSVWLAPEVSSSPANASCWLSPLTSLIFSSSKFLMGLGRGQTWKWDVLGHSNIMSEFVGRIGANLSFLSSYC